MGIALVFMSFTYLLIVWLRRILVNLIGEPSLTYTIGLDPKHFNGIVMGVGLFFIMIISSSINGFGSSGIAHTLNYLGG